MSLNNAEKTQHKDDSQSNSIAAGEVSEDVDASAAVAGGHEEDNDGSNNTLSQNSSTQLHPSEKEKMGIISGFCASQYSKQISVGIEFISIIKKVDFIMFFMAALCNRGALYFCPVISIFFLWSPYVMGQTIIFLPCDFYLSSFFLSSPNLSGRRLDVYHTSTHGVA